MGEMHIWADRVKVNRDFYYQRRDQDYDEPRYLDNGYLDHALYPSSCDFDFGIKLEIPDFHGLVNTDEFLDWLSWGEKVFEYKYIPYYKKAKLVVTKMTGYALVWWDSLHNGRLLHGKRRIKLWDKMKKKLQEEFISAGYERELCNDPKFLIVIKSFKPSPNCKYNIIYQIIIRVIIAMAHLNVY